MVIRRLSALVSLPTTCLLLASGLTFGACSSDDDPDPVYIYVIAGSTGTGGSAASQGGSPTKSGSSTGGSTSPGSGGTAGDTDVEPGTAGDTSTSTGGRAGSTGGRAGQTGGKAGTPSEGGMVGEGGSTEPGGPAMPPVKADGFTDFQPSDDTRTIYVSAEGDDANDGLSEDSPVLTPGAALSKVRDGFPDWVLFRRGDKFQRIGQVKASGRSADEPILFGSYGTSTVRPRFTGGGFQTSGAQDGPERTNFLVFFGLDFNIELRDPSHPEFDPTAGNSNQALWLRGSDGVWIEDCVFQWAMVGFEEGDNLQIYNLTFKRTQFLDTYDAEGAHIQGIFLNSPSNTVFDECLFDHNGWNETVDGAESTIFNHNIYVQNGSTGTVMRNTISMRASSHGLQFRGGGTIEDSFFFRNPISILIGGGTNPEPEGVVGVVRNNVVLEGVDMGSGLARGGGIDLENIQTATVEGNIVAHCLGTGCVHMGNADAATFTDNTIVDWNGPHDETEAGDLVNGAATLADYAATLDMTLDEFYAALREQSQFNWREELTARAINEYFRAQYAPN